MFSKKKPGYYWRLRRELIKKIHQGDTIYLGKYPEKTQAYIIHMAFKDLPQITIVLGKKK